MYNQLGMVVKIVARQVQVISVIAAFERSLTRKALSKFCPSERTDIGSMTLGTGEDSDVSHATLTRSSWSSGSTLAAISAARAEISLLSLSRRLGEDVEISSF